jgi:hypothetical protein
LKPPERIELFQDTLADDVTFSQIPKSSIVAAVRTAGAAHLPIQDIDPRERTEAGKYTGLVWSNGLDDFEKVAV